MRIFPCFFFACFLIGCGDNARKNMPSNDVQYTDTGITKMPFYGDTIFEAFSGKPIWSVFVMQDKEIVFMPGKGEELNFPFVRPTVKGDGVTEYNSASASNTINNVRNGRSMLRRNE